MTMQLGFMEKHHLTNLYTCVLVKGLNADGQKVYCYFGLFANSIDKLLDHLATKKPFNPKDFGAIVLARSTGEPSPEISEFMRLKFNFAENEVILEVSEPVSHSDQHRKD